MSASAVHRLEPPRIGLIGAGAVGVVLAAFLMRAGRCRLQLLVRPRDRSSWSEIPQLTVRRDGRLWRSPRPPLCDAEALAGMDYVLLCVKQTQLDAVLDSLPPLPASCTLVSTLNGPGALPRIRARLPNARLIAMPVMFNAQLLAPLQAQLSTHPRLLIPASESRLRAAFAGSGMRVANSSGEPSLWGKLLINLANAIAAITHTGFEDLLTQPQLRRCYVAVLDEAVALLHASGIDFQLPMPVPYALYRHLLAGRTPLPWWFARWRNGLHGGAYPSMVADVEHNRGTEVRELNGEILRLAEKLHRDAPVNRRLIERVEAMREQRPPTYLQPGELLAQLSGYEGAA